MDLRYERNLVVNNKQLHYAGWCRVDDVLNTINKALAEKGYTRREKRSEELVTEAGKKVVLELRPFKEKKSNVTLQLNIRIVFDHLQQKVEEIKGRLEKVDDADVHIAIDGWFLADDQGERYMRPWSYMFRMLITKYLVDIHMHKGLESEVEKDTAFVYGELKKMFNAYAETQKQVTPEQDVIAAVDADIREVLKK